MRKQGLDAEIRSLIEPLADELTELVRRAALLAVEDALKPAKRGELIRHLDVLGPRRLQPTSR